jgi:uncharacterized paraquat-inducible protein A
MKDITRQYSFHNEEHFPGTPYGSALRGYVELRRDANFYKASAHFTGAEGSLALVQGLRDLADEIMAHAREKIEPIGSVFCPTCQDLAVMKRCPRCQEALEEWRKKYECDLVI